MALNMRTANGSAVRAARPARAMVCKAQKVNFGQAAVAAVASAAMMAGSASALTYDELQGLTYLQVKGTGVANTCPVIEGGSTNVKDIKSGNYKLTKFCMEPTSFTVKEESSFKGGETEFVKTKLMTRLTYTLDAIDADMNISGNNVTFKEIDGIDYAPVTVQLPGGERVAFLFTIKQFEGKGTLDSFSGDFTVPSYRGSTFLDPKGRGGSTGYDNAVGLQARADAEEFQKENVKSYTALKGSAVFSVAKVDAATGEIAGVFESIQPSDTDMGAKPPKDIKVTGLWYGQLGN
ncbi:hypothetical protein FOA52_007527 [Chlamydomonas sp. UWO 241]|nr:hypothetical protein FOA52_007527 [Chlamydomonas sp. UWO 241]